MDYQARLLPTREGFRRVQALGYTERDIAGVDLMLRLVAAADTIRAEVFGRLSAQYGLSEGKFALLMTLYGEGECSGTELARRIGVRAATLSMMVKRMLAAPEPLICMLRDGADARSRRICLTPLGRETITRVLPDHFRQIQQFSRTLNDLDQEQLIDLLQRLMGRS